MSARDTEPPKPQTLTEDEAERSFLSRWSRRKQAIARGETPAEPPPPAVVATPAPATAQDEPPLPDPLSLGMADDFSAFLCDKVPPALKHKAMQHLFSHPHFNELDMMDVYMEDFNLVPNLEPASLDLVKHAKAVLDPDFGQAPETQTEADPEAAADHPASALPEAAENVVAVDSTHEGNLDEDDPPAEDARPA